jgi:hypothetical protein
MASWQMWLVKVLDGVPQVAALMRSAWMWPLAESVHFIGLSMLVGSVVLFDLRLLGLAPLIPIRAMHRLIPLGLVGFALNAGTGLMFLLTDGGQYIYNPAFLFKVAFIAAAGANAAMFYLTVGGRVGTREAPLDAPRAAKLFASLSLILWLGVIIAGRLLTFYRPFDCAPGEASGAVLLCVPGPD